MAHFKRIALVANIQLPEIVDSLKRLSSFLEKSGCTVLLEPNTARLIDNKHLPVFDRDNMAQQLDLVIVVGGDGSMLSAVRSMMEYDIPLLGVNRG